MDVQENCIQLKIDTIISDINQNSQENQNEEKNQVTSLMGYIHCLDLFDFMKIYSKIQKHEILVQTALIYDSIGYSELSMDYINEALLLIPNAPSIILFKSGLFASLNKLDESQKWLVKYKYLIGKNKYDNYVHDSFRVIIYYLLEYEEYIILRKISSIENKYTNYIKDNISLYFIKSKTLEKLAQKFKNSDNIRYKSYVKESKEIKKKYLKNININRNEIEFLFDQGIRSENITKLLILINPNLLNYKPRKLIEYKKCFNKTGFSLFYTLIKISKILKLQIEANKYKKILNKNNNNENSCNGREKNNLNDIIKKIQEDYYNISTDNIRINTDEESMKKCKESIMNLYNSIWLKNSINKKIDNYKIYDIKDIKKNNSKYIYTNYYIHEGYYSKLNLKESILRNIEYNDNYKNKLDFDYILKDIKNEELNINIDSKNSSHKNSDNIKKLTKKSNSNRNMDIMKISTTKIKKEKKSSNSNKTKSNRAKNNLSDIIKKVMVDQPKEIKSSKRNKRNSENENNNKISKKSKKFCLTDNCANQLLSKSINESKKKKDSNNKIESNSLFSKNKNEVNNIKINKQEIKLNEEEKEKERLYNEYNKLKEDNDKEKIKIQKNKHSMNIEKNNFANNYLGKKSKDKDIKNVNNKNKLLTTNTSSKRITLIKSSEQSKQNNKNNHNNNAMSTMREEKKMDTEYGKYKDVREINLVSYCLKQLMKKKENKNKNIKHKEIVNLTEKIDLMIPQKVMDIEKQILQINEHKFLKSKSKKKKMLNKSIKKQIATFTFEKRMKKNNTQKNSDNNLFKNNKSSYSINQINQINFNNNMKNLKRTINNYGYKKELSKFKSYKYLHGNFYSNNNFLNINFNNYLNYNFNYSNRHDDKKRLEFRFNPSSDNKKRDNSNSKEKFNFRTINLDFKNMSTKLNNHMKKPLLSSFIDSKDKNKRSSDNKYDFVIKPYNKIKNSPSCEMNSLKRKLKSFKSTLINQKIKTSFSKYLLYSINKKNDAYYFSKSINTSEYNKYKNSSNKSKNMKNRYNKTINNNSKIINK